METKPRRAWLAALLSLLGGPLGQVYAGRFRRSLMLWFVGALLLPLLAFSSISLPLGRLGLVLLLLSPLAYPMYLAADAFLLARRNPGIPLKRYQRWWIYLLVFFAFSIANFLIAHAVREFVAEAFVVPTRAMSPTIQAGDRILVDKFWCNANRLHRGDVVAFRSNGPGSPLYVMRVSGLPGDEIQIENERVLINGTRSNENDAAFKGPLPSQVDISNYGPETIPPDCFFVLGDNRRLANDSRFRGPIPLADFYGKAAMIILVTTASVPPIHMTRRGFTLGRSVGTEWALALIDPNGHGD